MTEDYEKAVGPRRHYYARVIHGDYGSHEYLEPRNLRDSNLVSSRVADGIHWPALDLDFPAYLVPSSTRGHFHLYLQREVSWRNYRRLLRALYRAGLIERGYYKQSLKRRATHIRTPWTRKTVLPASPH